MFKPLFPNQIPGVRDMSALQQYSGPGEEEMYVTFDESFVNPDWPPISDTVTLMFCAW